MIRVDGGARNPKVPTLFQVADVDTGISPGSTLTSSSHRSQMLMRGTWSKLAGERWALVKPSTNNRDAALQPDGRVPATAMLGSSTCYTQSLGIVKGREQVGCCSPFPCMTYSQNESSINKSRPIDSNQMRTCLDL